MQNSRRLSAILVFAFVVLGIWLTKAFADQQRLTLRLIPEPSQAPAGAPSKPAEPPKKGPVDYSKFNHADHDGEVQKLTTKGTMKLECNYCHLVENSDKRQTGFGEFPCENPETAAKAAGKRKLIQHSACIECHKPQFAGAGAKQQLCLICHTQFGFKPGLPLRPYPNPQSASQFSLTFPHKSHRKKVTFAYDPSPETDLIASLEPASLGLGRPAAMAAPSTTFECTACHNIEAAGVYAAKPQHRECFVCHMKEVDERYKSVQSEPYADDCASCHPKMKTNPFKDSPQTSGFRVVNLNETDKDGKVIGGPLFKHDGDHAVLQKVGDTGKSLSCAYCHGNVNNEPSRSKIKTEDDRKKFVLSSFPDACAGCHTLKKKPLVVGLISKSSKFGNIFAVGSCDRCHTQDMIDKDNDYHKKQQNPPKSP